MPGLRCGSCKRIYPVAWRPDAEGTPRCPLCKPDRNALYPTPHPPNTTAQSAFEVYAARRDDRAVSDFIEGLTTKTEEDSP